MPATVPRLFAFIREHQEQARTADDELRTELWDAVTNQLLDRTCQAPDLRLMGRCG